MQFEKPKVQRVYVTVTDPDTRKSVTRTVYGSTTGQVIAALEAGVKPSASQRKKGGVAAKHGGQPTASASAA